MAKLEVPEGVEAFNLWTLTIMAQLWDTFPQPQWFQSAPDAVLVTPDYRQRGSPIGPTGPEQVALFAHTLEWLIAEGFVRGRVGQGRDFPNVVLTTKGFSVLNHVPDSLPLKSEGDGAALGTRMRAALTRAAPDLAVALVRSMLER